MTFTPGSYDPERTDTYEYQKEQLSKTKNADEEFEEAQSVLKTGGEALYNIGKAGLFITTGSTQAGSAVDALRDKVEGKTQLRNVGINYGPNDGFGGWEPVVNEVFESNTEETLKGLAQYSSGNVVQTEDGPLYRAGDIISNVFQMVDDPEPIQRKTPGVVEQELLTNRFVNELYTYVDVTNRKGELVRKHISKIQPNAYKELGKAKAEWNQWAKRTGYIRLLSDKTMTAYVEHLVGKDKFYDWFWTLPNEQRFRKGSRHGPNNVRILKDNRMKTFKDTAEGILKRLYPNPTVKTGLLFDYEFGPRKGKSIMIDQSPGDLLLKRANGTVVGKLGDYHDVLYAPYQELVKGLSETINEETGRPFITTKLPDGTPLRDEDIRAQISLWRTEIISNKIELIVEKAPELAGKTKKERNRLMDEAIAKDMVNILKKHPFLKPGKRLRALLNQEDFKKLSNDVQSEDEKLNPEFLTKDQARRRKLQNRRVKSILRSLFGNERIDRD